MNDERFEVAFDHRHRRRIGGPVVSDDRLQAAARLGRGGGFVERLSPARLDLGVMALGQLGGHVAQGMHRAALLISCRPQLPNRLPQPGGAVGADEPGSVDAAGDQLAAEGQPVLVALAGAELPPEQDFPALQRHGPGDQHPLGGWVVGVQLELNGVEEQVDQVVFIEPPLAPAAVALAGVLQDPRYRRARADGLVEGVLEHRLHVAR